jgi:hypoxanthine phosphoribosyltransferase
MEHSSLTRDIEQVETLISAQRIHDRVEEMGRRIMADYPERSGDPPLLLAGVLKGSIVFLADLARAIRRHVSFDFLGVSSYGSSTESSGEIRLTKDLDGEIEGLDVLLVEDIVDTGLTVEWLCTHLRRRNPRSLRVATLLDKPSRRLKPVPLAYVGFEIPDEFVVGYGLDYAQRYRNRPDIAVLRGVSA